MSGPSGKNPFRPGVGTRPAYLAGRDAPMRRFSALLRSAPEQPANMRVTGLRGVGKTVLLGEFERIAGEAAWAAGFLEFAPAHNEDAAVVRAIGDLADRVTHQVIRMERIKAALGRAGRVAGSLGVTYNEVKVTFEPGMVAGSVDLSARLFEVVEVAVDKGLTGVVLLLDEAQIVRDDRTARGDHPLSLLISAVASLQRREIPIGLVVCGLPTLTGNLLRARSYTERMFRGEEVGRLDAPEAAAAFTEPLKGRDVHVHRDLVDAVVEEVEGYPYFIQLWGAELWDAAVVAEVDDFSVELLDAARAEIYRRLDIDFYEPRIATLTPAEQDVLLASAQCPYPPLATVTLYEAIDKTPGNINVLMGRLVEAGVIYRVRKGQYEYTAPKFREYLLRRAS